MNEKIIKNKKKTEVTAKTFIFWGILGLIVLVLISLLIVRIVQTKDVNSYNNVEEVVGTEIFIQEEENYFVLVYDFAGTEEMETFDQTIFQYLTFYRDNKGSENAYKLYKALSTNRENQKCFGSSTNITNTTLFPNSMATTGTDILQIPSSSLPVLLVVNGAEDKIVSYKSGVSSILEYLDDLMR